MYGRESANSLFDINSRVLINGRKISSNDRSWYSFSRPGVSVYYFIGIYLSWHATHMLFRLFFSTTCRFSRVLRSCLPSIRYAVEAQMMPEKLDHLCRPVVVRAEWVSTYVNVVVDRQQRLCYPWWGIFDLLSVVCWALGRLLAEEKSQMVSKRWTSIAADLHPLHTRLQAGYWKVYLDRWWYHWYSTNVSNVRRDRLVPTMRTSSCCSSGKIERFSPRQPYLRRFPMHSENLCW